MTERMPPAPHMCATCHRVLTPLELPSGQVSWHHGFDTDHETVPIPVVDGEMVGVCDFCSEPEVAWIAECTPFTTSVPVPTGIVDSQDDGAWAACEPCGAYIRRGDWPRLLYRAEKSFNRSTGLETHGLVAHMHDAFRHHFTGVIERYRDS